MQKTLDVQKYVLIIGIPFLLIVGVISLAYSPSFNKHSNVLAIGITIDLLVTIPFVYFLCIRKTTIPKTTVVPFMIVGMLVCYCILPVEQQKYLAFFKTWMLPLVELCVLSVVIYKLRKGIRTFQNKRKDTFDFFTQLKDTCKELLPRRLVVPVVTEIAVFYYGFFYWKKKILKATEYSYHKNSGSVALLIALLLIIGIETVALHGLLAKWSSVAAWILTIISMYSGFQILGFLKSMYKRPISIENETLFLRYGIMSEVNIAIKDIERIEITSKDLIFDNDTKKLSFLGELETHNIVLHVKKEQTLIGLYGVKRSFLRLALYVDEKSTFKNQLQIAIDSIEKVGL